MTVLTTWDAMRWQFGLGGASSNILYGQTVQALTFAAGPPATISGAGDFVVNRHAAGHNLSIIGSALNDGVLYTIDTVAAGLVTLIAADTLVAEGPVVCAIFSLHKTPDLMPEYPSEIGHTNLVRSGGFTGGLTGIPAPYAGVSFTVTCNAGAADAVYGVDDYHWYLSQRSDTPANQMLSCTQVASSGGNSYSGSIQIVHTALAEGELGFTAPDVTQDINRAIFRDCHLYCQRRSDGAIQWVDLTSEMMEL